MFDTDEYRQHRGHRGGKRFAHAGRGGDDASFDDERHGRRGRFFKSGGRGHRGHRKDGLGRFFAHGDLRLVILALVDEKPSHGYEIIKAIEERVGGAYSPSPGVIYPTLTLLEELGYVTLNATGEGSKKLCEITAEGKAYLDANQRTLEALLARMDEAGSSHRSGAAPQIVRAMENLKLALRLRVSNGPLTQEQAGAVAAAIDAAAIAVEKA
jgi:DNA-binding PadR family transcriptional regulator